MGNRTPARLIARFLLLRLSLVLLLLPGSPAFSAGTNCPFYFQHVWGEFAPPSEKLRGSLYSGGFAHPVLGAEVEAINRQMGGSTFLSGHIDSVLASASRERGFFRKAAIVIRGIAGHHLFDNGNKRTAQAVYELLKTRNQIAEGVGPQAVKKLIQRISTGEIQEIDAIEIELRGYRLRRPIPPESLKPLQSQ